MLLQNYFYSFVKHLRIDTLGVSILDDVIDFIIPFAFISNFSTPLCKPSWCYDNAYAFL